MWALEGVVPRKTLCKNNFDSEGAVWGSVALMYDFFKTIKQVYVGWI